MSPRPAALSGLTAEPDLATITLTWDSLGFDPLIDHYRIYAVEGETAPADPAESALLAKTVYPRFVHEGLDPGGGDLELHDPRRLRRGQARHILRPGHRHLTALGHRDRHRDRHHRRVRRPHPRAPLRPQLLLPHPDRAPRRADRVPRRRRRTRHRLAVPAARTGRCLGRPARRTARVDPRPRRRPGCGPRPRGVATWTPPASAASCGSARTISTSPTSSSRPGATRGSRDGDATLPGSTLQRCFFEPAIPAALLQAGENVIEFELAEGGWVAWDAVGLYARA